MKIVNGRQETGDRRQETGKKMAGKVEKFEDLLVWQEGFKLSVSLYKALKNCKDWGLKDQIQRSAVSIPSNTCPV